jgi:Holliday junction resolvasome RuvABC ATP-dependent DNA helicase subunit
MFFILLGGNPGVGKSTLAILIAASVALLCKPQIGIELGLQNDTKDDVDDQQQGGGCDRTCHLC